jgi:hypothetical protein
MESGSPALTAGIGDSQHRGCNGERGHAAAPTDKQHELPAHATALAGAVRLRDFSRVSA